jgi:hypothetical protein
VVGPLHLFRLKLDLEPLRAQRSLYFAFDLRSLVPRSLRPTAQCCTQTVSMLSKAARKPLSRCPSARNSASLRVQCHPNPETKCYLYSETKVSPKYESPDSQGPSGRNAATEDDSLLQPPSYAPPVLCVSLAEVLGHQVFLKRYLNKID